MQRKRFAVTKMTTKTQPFDLSAHLKTDENIREFLDIMLEENGAEGFEQALVHVAKAKGMAHLLPTQSTLSQLPLSVIDQIIHTLGLRLSVRLAS